MIRHPSAPPRAVWLALVAGAALTFACGGAPDEVGRSWSSLPDLQHAMEDAGWTLVGRVGALPGGERARVAATADGRDALNFSLRDGTPHVYEGFDGYDLRMLRLETESGAEMAVIFRASAPRPAEAE